MKHFLLITLLIFSLAAPHGARAQSTMLASEGGVVTVEINKGTLVRLSRPASSVVISDPVTADVQVVSPKLILVRGKKIGETSFYAIDDQDEPIVSSIINVTHNLSSLQRAVRRAAPDADIEFKTVDGGLVLEGFANNVSDSQKIRDVAQAYVGGGEKMVNLIKTNGSDQVMLRVKIVEMSRNDLKRIGVNLQNVTNNGAFGLQVIQGQDILFNTADPDMKAYRAFGNVLSRTNSNTNLMLRYKDFAGLVDALETQGLATTLAEPSLTTTSGQAASFLAGGQFPMPVAGQDRTVTIQYQPFGVSLNFTPVVMGKDKISLTVAPEVSTLNFSNPIQVQDITYPILNTRKASAVVELGSGDSFMLAGLMQSDSSNNIDKFPGLGDLPILGALFRSTQFQNNQTELVILVTPYIVHPVARGGKLQTPVDGYQPPSDLESIMSGSLYRQQPMKDEEQETEEAVPEAPAKEVPLPELHGEGGFITE